MIFLGTQPTLTQVPPRRPASISTARAPYSAARCAVASPPLPPPITTRSKRSSMHAPCYMRRRARCPAGAVGYNARMENPLLARDRLPRSVQIRPEHVEPAVRELLERNRARIGELAALAAPTFATLVEPLEELQHGITRTWSPVSHLNAVLNSEAL